MQINFLAVVAAAVVNMVIGGVWYSPGVFGKTWMNLAGVRPGTGSAGPAYAQMFVVALIFAYVLARFVGYAQAHTLAQGLALGFWVWLGFVATTSAGDYIFGGRPRQLFVLNNGYQLLTLLVNGSLLALWR